jgi:hypothetical protein
MVFGAGDKLVLSKYQVRLPPFILTQYTDRRVVICARLKVWLVS